MFSQKVTLVSKPELKTTKGNNLLASANVVYFGKNKTDREGSHASFINIEAWDQNAEALAALKKGDTITIEGEIYQRRWQTKEGKNASNFYLSVSKFSKATP